MSRPSPPTDGTASPRTAVVIQRTPDCIVRNYDADRSYDVTLVVRDGDDVVLDREVTIAPDSIRDEFDVLDDGTYEVDVTTDRARATATCTVGSRPEETILLELGNWHVSVTNGL